MVRLQVKDLRNNNVAFDEMGTIRTGFPLSIEQIENIQQRSGLKY